ncbi:MAG TPA: BON domain-containing protein [Candidatus Sulfotelmatobacter sp.]|nr:BON domain-containing protein [Candidatus Sulfotelmatobacter sp.]
MKFSKQSVYSCVLGMILLLGLGCARKLDDAKMSSEIQSKFSQDSGLGSKQLSVQSNNGVVTLSGTVDNAAQREAAAQQAASIAGVKTVINNIQVGNAASDAGSSSKPMPAVEASVPDDKPEPPAKAAKAKAPKHSRAARNSDEGPATPDRGEQTSANNSPAPAMNSAPAAPEHTSAPAPPPAPRKLIIDQGTQLAIRLVDAIDSEKNQTGDTFHATLNAALTSDGQEALPAGVDIVGHLVSVKSAGKFKGQSEVVLQLDSVTSAGKTYNLQTDQYTKTGSSRGKNTAMKVGGGAAIGSIIGAIAGGGKGAAIGAAAGAGVGGGVQAATKGQQIKLPSETVLNFTLQSPVTVLQSEVSNRPKLGNSQ